LVITILAFVFVLGVLVFVHELGHFLAAKRVGIRVLRFQLGFDPKIYAIQRGDTEYSIGVLPLGGFVKMAGENPDDVTHDEQGNVVRRPDEFMSKTKWERFQVLIMGPVMNLLLAVLLTAVVLHQGIDKEAYEDQPVVVGVIAEGSVAAKAGIHAGDRIVSVAGHDVADWDKFLQQIGTKANREITLGLVRDGREQTLTLTPAVLAGQSKFEIGDIGVLPNVHPHLKSVTPNDPGDKGGLKAGDVITAIDGQPIVFHWHMREAIAKHPGQPMQVSILRGGAAETLTVTPEKRGTTGWLGVLPVDDMVSSKPGVGEALKKSVEKNIEMARLIFQTLGGLFTRETSPKQLMGPIAIAQLSGESAQLGWIALMSLMASISLNLGLLNLMPVPVLDGGHIFIMALEGLARRDFSQAVKEKMLMAGFAVILMLMVTVIYNDLTRISWIERLMPWR
jgi:regulator of sigma E protease